MCKHVFFIVLIVFQCDLLADEVNIYSARKQALIKPLLDRFTEKTGITVNLVTGKADTLIKRLEVEGRNTPADLLITVDVARLYRAKQSGLFQTIDSNVLNKAIPARYRDPEGYWYGLSLRSRVFVYAPDRVKPEELSDYEALSEPVWKGRLCVRSSSNVYNQSLVAAMIVNKGLEETERWGGGLVDNFARTPKGGDRDQIKAVAVGQCDVALVNTYYLAGMLHSKRTDEKTAAQKVRLFWPGQDDHGAHVNISGVGVIKTAKHVAEAVELIEFLVSDDAQIWYAEQNYEYPVKEGIKISDTLKQWGNFTLDKLNLGLLGKNNAEAVRLMDRVGWK